jgi:hypothetical protein
MPVGAPHQFCTATFVKVDSCQLQLQFLLDALISHGHGTIHDHDLDLDFALGLGRRRERAAALGGIFYK